MRSALLPVLIAGAAGLAAVRPAAAQEAPGLDRIEAAADSGRADSARAMLVRWFAARADDAAADERDRARYLRARLTADADSAAGAYLEVAVAGSPGYGDRAWLRLAQLRLTEGEPERALQALDRLRADYPGTDLAAESWLWTGHARREAGSSVPACDAWQRALDAAGRADGDVRRRARAALEGCGEAAPAEGRAAADTSRAGWVVQLGAFRDRSGAERLRRTAGEKVSAVEVVVVPPGPGEDLFRVQTRPPAARADARRLADELESRQLSAIVVRTGP